MKFSTGQLEQVRLSLEKVRIFEGALLVGGDLLENAKVVEGIEKALLTVAIAYRVGAGVSKDKNKAIKYLQQGILLHSGDAAKELSNIFTHDDWWGKESYDIDAEECQRLAKELWKIEAKNGRSAAAWSLYYASGTGTNEGKAWVTKAIDIAEKCGDHEEARWMKETYKSDQISSLRNYDLLGMPLRNLEIYFQKDPPGGERNYLDEVSKFHHEEEKTEMRKIQQNILNKIKEIKRTLSAAEVEEIERLTELCNRDV